MKKRKSTAEIKRRLSATLAWLKANKTEYDAKAKIERAKQSQRASRYATFRRAVDPEFKLRCKMQSKLTIAIRQKRLSSMIAEYIGCSIEQLFNHLESQFAPGMTWDNYGKWHVDHRIPASYFKLSDPDQAMACYHFSNLQPLWAIENFRKGNRWCDV